MAKLFFAYGLGNSLTFPFGAGATDDPRTRAADARRHLPSSSPPSAPTLFFASPGFVAALLDTDGGPEPRSPRCGRRSPPASRCRPTCSGASRQRFGHPVLDGIGSTEALHIFISNTLDGAVAGHRRDGSCRATRPSWSTTTATEIVEADTPGYLHVRGPSTATRLLERDDGDRGRLPRRGWLRTGDVYTRSADDYLDVPRPQQRHDQGRRHLGLAGRGRVDARSRIPTCWRPRSSAPATDQGLEETVAFVVARAGHAIDDRRSIDAHCREHMAAFKRPRRVVVVDELPKTATGKIQRFKLRDSLTG